jgi:glycerol-3-phosphate acyltransferase PlsY
MHPAAGLAFAYLFGSIPAAHIAGKAHGVDLRQHGSGNLGATNAWRVLGWPTGLAVYVFDTLKGALPVLFLPGALHAMPPSHWAIAYGLAAIVGHVKPIFLLGKGGGKGVATAGGVFAALVPIPLAIAFTTFLLVLLATGYVSLGSLCAAVALPIAIAVRDGVRSPAFGVSCLVTLFIFWSHRANVGRLRRGEESRFRRGARQSGASGPVVEKSSSEGGAA